MLTKMMYPRISLGAGNDLFAYFKRVGKHAFTIEELKIKARALNIKYSSLQGYHRVLTGKGVKDYEQGRTKWVHVQADGTAAAAPAKGRKKKAKSSTLKQQNMTNLMSGSSSFCGDRSLAQSIAFMSDAVKNLEMVSASSACDGGRLFEAVKVGIRSALQWHQARLKTT